MISKQPTLRACYQHNGSSNGLALSGSNLLLATLLSQNYVAKSYGVSRPQWVNELSDTPWQQERRCEQPVIYHNRIRVLANSSVNRRSFPRVLTTLKGLFGVTQYHVSHITTFTYLSCYSCDQSHFSVSTAAVIGHGAFRFSRHCLEYVETWQQLKPESACMKHSRRSHFVADHAVARFTKDILHGNRIQWKFNFVLT